MVPVYTTSKVRICPLLFGLVIFRSYGFAKSESLALEVRFSVRPCLVPLVTCASSNTSTDSGSGDTFINFVQVALSSRNNRSRSWMAPRIYHTARPRHRQLVLIQMNRCISIRSPTSWPHERVTVLKVWRHERVTVLKARRRSDHIIARNPFYCAHSSRIINPALVHSHLSPPWSHLSQKSRRRCG